MNPDQEKRWRELCEAIFVAGPLPIRFKLGETAFEARFALIAELETLDIHNPKAVPTNGVTFKVRFSFPLDRFEWDPTRAILVKYALKVYEHELYEQLRDSREPSLREQMFAHENVHPNGTSQIEQPHFFNL